MCTHISPTHRSGTPWLALERPSWLPCLRTRAERVREGVIAEPATLAKPFPSSASFPRHFFLVKLLRFAAAPARTAAETRTRALMMRRLFYFMFSS